MFHAVGGAVHATDDAECLSLLRTPLLDAAGRHGRAARRSGSVQAAADAGGTALVKPTGSVAPTSSTTATRWSGSRSEGIVLANKFRWKDVETIPRTEFDAFTIVAAAEASRAGSASTPSPRWDPTS